MRSNAAYDLHGVEPPSPFSLRGRKSEGFAVLIDFHLRYRQGFALSEKERAIEWPTAKQFVLPRAC